MTEAATEEQPTQAEKQTIWDRSAAGRMFARVMNFELVMISTLLMLPLTFGLPFRDAKALLRDPDIWWHLANARHLFASGFIHVEPYAFTVAGKPWINPEWIAEIPYWLGYSTWGVHGLLIVAIIVAELNILGIYLLAKLRTGHMWSSFIATFIATPLMFVNFGTRTILWGYLCLILELLILEAWKQGHRRMLWLLPPLFCLWVNTHGSWAIGALIFLVFVICSHISLALGDFYTERLPLPALRQIWVVTALSVAALFINPYTWQLVWYPAAMVFYQKVNIAIVQEWQPLRLDTLIGKIVVLLGFLFLLTNGIRRRRWHLFDLFLVAFGFYAAVDHSRFCFLLVVLVTPVLAFELHRVWLHAENPNQKRPLLNIAFMIAIWVFAISQVPSGAQMRKAYDQKFPTRLVAEIQPGWRVMNAMNLGGFLAFHHKSDFIDSRYDTFEYHGILTPFLQAMTCHDTLAILRRYKVDHVLFGRDSPMVYLLLHTGGWKEIDQQNGYDLLARKTH